MAIITGLQVGFVVFYAKEITQHSEEVATSFTPGVKNVSNEALVLPPLHIRLGLTENFEKGMNKDDEGFQ